MNAGFQGVTRRRVGKDALRHPAAIDPSFRVDDGFPEEVESRGGALRSRLVEVADDGIRVENGSPPAGKKPRDRRFAGREAAREADPEHRRPSTAAAERARSRRPS